jgi:integrase/recombinase XerD
MIYELVAQISFLEEIHMQRKPLAVLINDLEQEMIRLGYTEGSMKFYRSRWQKLLQFAHERGETYYSEGLGINFVEKYFQILEKDFDRTLSQSETQELRIIRMIGDFQLHTTILRRYYKHKEIITQKVEGLNFIKTLGLTLP